MMTAHILYEGLDDDRPATLSPIIMQTVIREAIGFHGLLLSDDLAMNALAGTPLLRAEAALAAGCDIALYCPGDAAGNEAILEALAEDGALRSVFAGRAALERSTRRTLVAWLAERAALLGTAR